MKLKVYVEDHDDNSNDYVDFLQTVISLAPAKAENTAITNTYYLRRRTRYVRAHYWNATYRCYVFVNFSENFSCYNHATSNLAMYSHEKPQDKLPEA